MQITNPKHLIRPILRRFGRDLVPYNHFNHPMARRAKLMETYHIDMVLDVGANIGQYASELREGGYRGKIVSFEPMGREFVLLKQLAKRDGNINAVHSAVGDQDGTVEFNIAANSTSSSILEMLPSHTDAAPDSAIQAKEVVPIARLDSIYDDHCTGQMNTLLKIDTQGFEMSVLEGAKESILKVQAIQIEMSLVPLYKEQVLFADLALWLKVRGFHMVDINPMFVHPRTGEVLQVDGIFRAPVRS